MQNQRVERGEDGLGELSPSTSAERPGFVQFSSAVEITGVKRSPDGDTHIVELEVSGSKSGLSLAQSGRDTSLHGVMLGNEPLLLIDAVRNQALLLENTAAPLCEVEDVVAFNETVVADVMAPIADRLGDGLFSVERRQVSLPLHQGPKIAASACVLDPGGLAPDGGTPVVLDAGSGFFALLAGRDGLQQGRIPLVVSGRLLLGGEGIDLHRYDLGAREGFARSWRHLLDERAVRDAMWRHAAAHPDLDLGRFAPEVMEPAAAQARALLFDLGLMDSSLELGRPFRLVDGGEVAFVAPMLGLAGSGPIQLLLLTSDGVTLNEARVRWGDAWETGLRPSARALSKTLVRLRASWGGKGA